jgi:uncharacterized repeat protein (TIGR01451 family)
MLRKQPALNTLVVVALVLAVIGITPVGAVPLAAPTTAPANDGPRQLNPPVDIAVADEGLTPEQALNKIDPALREAAQKGSSELVGIYVSVRPGTDLSQYLSNLIVRPVGFGGLQYVFGQAPVGSLGKIASVSGVVAIASSKLSDRPLPFDPEAKNVLGQAALKARLNNLRANALTYAEAEAKTGDVGAQGWFDVLDGHKSSEAWTKGFDGNGVIVAVLDDGIDFAHPDLQGTTARVTDPSSPYYGWPMAFSQASTQYFAYDVFLGTNNIATGAASSRWASTAVTRTGQTLPWDATKVRFSFQPLSASSAHTYVAPKASKSGIYKLGSLPEMNLRGLYGERVAVLVVDAQTAGVYDTVYVDLDNNYDFTDEKPATKASPEVYRDMDGDGYADISGGQIVWISDGDNPPPVTDWLWGVSCATNSPSMKGCPDDGSLVLFAGAFAAGYTHGTQCASNVAGQGVVNGGASAPAFAVGGMVQGAAPKASLMDMGNLYASFTADDHYLVAALGYDGVPTSGDEVQVASNSYGNFTQMWGGWGYTGRLITALNLSIAPSTVYLFSGGNEGPGYGPQEGEGGPTIIKVGTSTQFGSTNWDSIMDIDQIVYGDPSSFGAKGPNRDGSAGLDILANGGRGAGDEGLNYYGFNGAESWATWGGTSRSSPVAAGNLALVYQAYKARHGVWPTWEEVLPIFKSSATNSVSAPFFQGAGVVNADRATDVASGLYGVYATPDEWQVGNWQGVEYLNFAKVARPGSTYTKTYEVRNPSGYNINVSLSDGYMKLITKTQMTFTTSPESQESSFNFHSPDYLMKMDSTLIPADAEVMIVKYAHPYRTFDPAYDYTADPNSSWRFMLYNWTDQNKDGKLWTDANANGVVNHVDITSTFDNDGFHPVDYSVSEIQQGEYIRMDYEFGGLSVPIIVRDPLDRMADGYFFGFQHRFNDHTVATTTIQIGVEFYKRADWPWLSLSNSTLAVPANGSAAFNAVATIPANALPGDYEGVIYMTDPGDANHAAHETALPVVVNVVADLSNNGATLLGGTPMADTMYQNAWSNGYFNWYGGGWTGAGDWRHYFLDITSADVANQNLLIHSSWSYTPTDFNTWVLGPTLDCASNGEAPCAFWEPGIGQPDPAAFGPYTLQPIASSEPFRAGAAYPFDTSTGGPADWVKAPLTTDGLHEIALHNVLFAGIDLAEQFRVDVGTIALDPVMDPAVGEATVGSIDANAYTNTGQIDINITPSIAVPDLSFTLAGGLATTRYNQPAVLVPDNGQNFSAWDPDNVVKPFQVNEAGTTLLKVHLNMPPAQDIDFFLVRDVNNNGLAEQGVDAQVGSSGNGAGEDEEITVANPQLAQYLAVMAGYDVEPNSGVNTDWWYEITAPGNLPSEPLTVFSNTVQITQTQFVTSANTYTYTVTADNRASALYAWVGNFTTTADIDLYVSDSLGNIVASSATTATTELATVTPASGYRFAAGAQYTVWVHGKSIATPPADVDLRIWWDHLNVWLSSAHPDVHVDAIQPDETVSVTLHFDKSSWPLGQSLSARLVGDMSVMPGAFDELVTITRANPPATDLAAFATKSGVSVHGPGQNVFGAPYNLPGHQLLVGPNEPVTYTVRFTNTSDTAGTFYVEDYWGANNFTFDQFLGVTPTNYGFYSASGFRVLYITTTLQPGQGYEFTYRNVVTAGIPLGTGYLNFVDVYDDASAELLFDGFAQGGWLIAHYRGFSNSATTGFAAYTQKLSMPSVVQPGQTYTYRLSMLNPSSIAQPVKITDTLPAGVTYVSSNPPMTYDPVSHTLYLSLTVPGHGSIRTNVDIQVTAGAAITIGTQYQNTAQFYNGSTNALLTTKSAVTTVGPSADVQVAKTANKLLARVGDTVKYTIVVKNNGPQTAVFPAGFADYVPLTLDVVTSTLAATKPSLLPLYDPAQHLLGWGGNLAVGEVVTVTFDAKVNHTANTGLALINLAQAGASNAGRYTFSSALTEILETFYIYMPLVRR